jgi:Uma2 family endonuclease
MATGTLISEEEYLHTSYEHDPEFEDGVVIERGMPTVRHGELQAALATYFGNRRRSWNLKVYTELTFKIRLGKYMIPDVAVILDPQPEGRYGTQPPLIWIEVLSPDDRPLAVNDKVEDVVKFGAPFVWIIDPETLESELHTSEGRRKLKDGILRIPGTPIEVPLFDVLAD